MQKCHNNTALAGERQSLDTLYGAFAPHPAQPLSCVQKRWMTVNPLRSQRRPKRPFATLHGLILAATRSQQKLSTGATMTNKSATPLVPAVR
jgi:hypothetical protein